MLSRKPNIYIYINVTKPIITVILNNHNNYRNGRGTGLSMIPKFQYQIIQMAADSLGTYWTCPSWAKVAVALQMSPTHDQKMECNSALDAFISLVWHFWVTWSDHCTDELPVQAWLFCLLCGRRPSWKMIQITKFHVSLKQWVGRYIPPN